MVTYDDVFVITGGLGIILLVLVVLVPLAEYHNKKYKASITWEPLTIAIGLGVVYIAYFLSKIN